MKEIGCKMIRPVHISPLSIANGTNIGLKYVQQGKQVFGRKAETRKICLGPAYFSLRFLKSARLPVSDNSAVTARPVRRAL